MNMPALTLQAKQRRGLSSPVMVPSSIDWDRDYSGIELGELLGMPNDDLADVDPLAMNLIVAKGIPSLGRLNVQRYQSIVNDWVLDLTGRCLPRWEPFFHQAPHDFQNDLRYFRLGMICQYLDQEIGVQYKPDQREHSRILYTDPHDLFLNGLIDTRQGTCGNMAALQVAIGWRLGLPVSLACLNAHYLLRFDDGESVYNIEATQSGRGGFQSDPDAYLIDKKKLPAIAIECGSDLRALRPREMLGVFVGLRARHLQDVGKHERDEAKIVAAESDWLLARWLFPTNRLLYRNQVAVSSMCGDRLFEPDEAGHPNTYAGCLDEIRRLRRTSGWSKQSPPNQSPSPPVSAQAIDDLFATMEDEL